MVYNTYENYQPFLCHSSSTDHRTTANLSKYNLPALFCTSSYTVPSNLKKKNYEIYSINILTFKTRNWPKIRLCNFPRSHTILRNKTERQGSNNKNWKFSLVFTLHSFIIQKSTVPLSHNIKIEIDSHIHIQTLRNFWCLSFVYHVIL